MREIPRRHRAANRAAVLPALTLLLLFGGCVSPREKLPALPPQLKLDISVLAQHPLKEGQPYQLLTLEETKQSSLHIFQLRPGGELPSRYHKRSDAIFFCMKGAAIVVIEDERFALRPGESVLVPNYRIYRIIHNASTDDFVAAVVFAPAYDPNDRVDVQERHPRAPTGPTGIGTPMTDAPVRSKK